MRGSRWGGIGGVLSVPLPLLPGRPSGKILIYVSCDIASSSFDVSGCCFERETFMSSDILSKCDPLLANSSSFSEYIEEHS